MSDVNHSKSIEDLLAQIEELFGKPPVLPGSENIAAYKKMMRLFVEDFQPQSFFEMKLMKELTDGTWEAARWNRHRVLLLDRKDRARREAEATKRRKEWEVKKAAMAKRATAEKADPAKEPEEVLDHVVEDCDAILLEPATELDHNRALEATLLQQEKLIRMEAANLAKCDKALRQLEWYREGLGHRLREVSDGFIADYANDAMPASTETDAANIEDTDAPVQPR
jgi:hypothetical protein